MFSEFSLSRVLHFYFPGNNDFPSDYELRYWQVDVNESDGYKNEYGDTVEKITVLLKHSIIVEICSVKWWSFSYKEHASKRV